MESLSNMHRDNPDPQEFEIMMRVLRSARIRRFSPRGQAEL